MHFKNKTKVVMQNSTLSHGQLIQIIRRSTYQEALVLSLTFSLPGHFITVTLRLFTECRFPKYNNLDHVLIPNTTIPNPLNSGRIQDTPFGSGNSVCRKRKGSPTIQEIDVRDYDWSGLVHLGNMHLEQRQTHSYSVPDPHKLFLIVYFILVQQF